MIVVLNLQHTGVMSLVGVMHVLFQTYTKDVYPKMKVKIKMQNPQRRTG